MENFIFLCSECSHLSLRSYIILQQNCHVAKQFKNLNPNINVCKNWVKPLNHILVSVLHHLLFILSRYRWKTFASCLLFSKKTFESSFEKKLAFTSFTIIDISIVIPSGFLKTYTGHIFEFKIKYIYFLRNQVFFLPLHVFFLSSLFGCHWLLSRVSILSRVKTCPCSIFFYLILSQKSILILSKNFDVQNC